MQHRYLLFVRFLLVNIVATALVVAAFLQGWLDGLIYGHLRELSALIVLVFLYGLCLCGFRVWRHSADLDAVLAAAPDPESWAGRYLAQLQGAESEGRATMAAALRLRLTDRIVGIRDIANALIFLGLVGTVIGFIVALSGVDPKAAGDVENVSSMVATLINGMSVALHTTLTGAVLYIWLTLNYRILVSGTVDLIAGAMELGERRAGS